MKCVWSSQTVLSCGRKSDHTERIRAVYVLCCVLTFAQFPVLLCQNTAGANLSLTAHDLSFGSSETCEGFNPTMSTGYPVSCNMCVGSKCLSDVGCVCQLDDVDVQSDNFARSRLRFCDRYSLRYALANATAILQEKEMCSHAVQRLLKMDEMAYNVSSNFDQVLARYDCSVPYSTLYSCQDCKEAYKDWICSMFFPIYLSGERVRPCRSYCFRVMQRCPYFLPTDRPINEQYAGERNFLCLDQGVEETDEVTRLSPYGPVGSCYPPCWNQLSPIEFTSLQEIMQTNSCQVDFEEIDHWTFEFRNSFAAISDKSCVPTDLGYRCQMNFAVCLRQKHLMIVALLNLFCCFPGIR